MDATTRTAPTAGELAVKLANLQAKYDAALRRLDAQAPVIAAAIACVNAPDSQDAILYAWDELVKAVTTYNQTELAQMAADAEREG